MLRIALCDDEEIIKNEMSLLIEKICIQLRIAHKITKYTSGKVFLEEQRTGQQEKHDVIFMDIDMPEMDGIQTVKRYRDIDSKALIIFLTSHTEFSREGYKVNAFRFIDKIDKEEEFIEAINSVWRIQQEKKELVIISLKQKVLILDYNDIIYIEKQQRKTVIYSKSEGEIKIYESLASFRDKLQNHCFYQIHRAYIVNLNHVVKIVGKDVLLDNGESVPISEKKQSNFRKFLMNWKFDRGNS